jgi:hypothetical protein
MNDIEWVAESDWSKVTVGQKVRLVNPAGTVTGKVAFVRQDFVGLFRIVLEGLGTVWYADTWSLFVEAPPAVVLPTEPGNYLDKDGTAWRITARFPFREDLHARHSPFTRLEPVPETAKKVLDRIRSLGAPGWNLLYHLDQIAAEFGVKVDE